MNVIGVGGIGVSFVLAAYCAASSLAGRRAPDISGTYWATSYSPKIEVVGGGEPPLNAAGKAAYAMNRAGLRRTARWSTGRAGYACRTGCRGVLATPYPFEVFQVPAGQVTLLYEMNHQVRVIVLDKPLGKLDSLMGDPWYNGHSVGHWDGDTLVVETKGFNEYTFLDATGLPHSDEMSTVERIRKVGNELEDIITIHDPEMYAKDWQARFSVYYERADVRIEDYACNDTHRDSVRQVKGVRVR